MPQWYHCGVPGCQFEDFNYQQHECPEIINPPPKPQPQVVKRKVPRSHIKESDAIDKPAIQKTPAKVSARPAPANVSSVTTQDAQAREYIIQHSNQGNDEVVATLPITFDKKGRLLIVFSCRKQESYFEKQIILNCLKAFVTESEKLRTDKNGFTIILDRISKPEDVRLLTDVCNEVLQDKLKLILIVHFPKASTVTFRDKKSITPSEQAGDLGTESSMLSDNADSATSQVVPFFIPVQCLTNYIAVEQLSPLMGGTHKSRYISKPIYMNKRVLKPSKEIWTI